MKRLTSITQALQSRCSWLLILLPLLFLALINIHPYADGPKDMVDSAGFHFDPPSKIHNARNLVLFGHMVRENDEWTPYIHSPVYHSLQWLTFKTFGINLWTMKWVSMLGMTLALAMLLLLLNQEYGPRAMLWGSLLFIPNQVLFFMGRSSLIEPLLMGIGALSIYSVCQLYRKSNPKLEHALFAGVLAGLTLCTKFTGIALVLAPTLYVLFCPPQGRRKLSLAFLIGLALTLLSVEGFLFCTAHDQLLREVAFATGKNAHHSVLYNFTHYPLFFKLMNQHIVLGAALLTLSILPISKALRQKEAPPATNLMALTFVIGMLILSLAFYRPFRYFTPLMLPAIYLAAAGFECLLQNQKLRAITTQQKKRGCALFALTFFILLFIGPHIKLLDGCSMNHRLFSALALAILTSILLYRNGFPTYRPRTTGLLLTAVLSAHLALNISPVHSWVKKPDYAAHDFAQHIGSRWKNATIIGNSPNFSIIGNKHYGMKWEKTGLNETAIGRGQWSHMLVSEHWNNEIRFKRITKEHWKTRKLLGQLRIVHWKWNVYAKSMAPIEVGPLNAPTLNNPDPHSNQRAFGLAIQNNALTGLAAWDLEPNQPLRYTDFLALPGDQHIILKDLHWESILDGGFDCKKTSIPDNFDAIKGKALAYRGKGFLKKEYKASVKKTLNTRGQAAAFLWLSEGGPGSPQAHQAILHRNGQPQPIEIFHSSTNALGQFLSACNIPSDGTLEIRYQHDQPCEMLAWNFQPLASYPALNIIPEKTAANE